MNKERLFNALSQILSQRYNAEIVVKERMNDEETKDKMEELAIDDSGSLISINTAV